MTPEQITALVGSITGLVVALGAILVQLRQTHKLVNGRMSELLDATKLANQKIGELQGRDYLANQVRVAQAAARQSVPPTGTRPPSSPGINVPNDPSTTP
jgi:hypothetical protein